MRKCLYCYQSLTDKEQDFHPSCSKKIFGQTIPPELLYAEEDIEKLAKDIIQSQTAVTGVQAKISLHITSNKMGGYILKPSTSLYPELPEVEDLTMHLASIIKIKTAPHSLIRLKSGNLAYITKRIDRTKKGKLAMEDFCQLSERLTEDKYQGSYEQVAKTIVKYSSSPGLDLINFFELLLFSFITGNADMHLKNFSLLEQGSIGMTLSPAYDLVNTKLVNPADKEELALTLNGKKNSIKKQDFVTAMTSLHLDEKQQHNIFQKMTKALPKCLALIDQSFLSAGFKLQYKEMMEERISRIK
jgi:serine/threonine-protein kinase HipA